VPKLVGRTLAKAKTTLATAPGTLGTVTRRTTHLSTRVGKVLTQSRKAGTKRPAGTKVSVTVGRRAPTS
jgi:beta-lactam-binding protein with PASTA domain